MKKLLRSVYLGIPGKLSVFRIIRFFANVPEMIWKHLYFEGTFNFTFKGKNVLLNDYNSSFETSIFWTNTFMDEKVSLEVWNELSKHSNTIIDVGANAGVYSIVAALANDSATIVAFEPISRIYKRLLENIEANQLNVSTEELALSNANGESIIYDLPVDHHYHASLNKQEVVHHAGLTEQVIRVCRFDDYAKEHGLSDIDLVKIDVEGFELEVLEGMLTTLKTELPSVLIELKDAKRSIAVEQMLNGLGYTFYNVDEAKGISNTTTLGASSKWNYVLLSPKHRHLAKLLETSN